MKIITISREFGSGGRELGKRMADLLHMDYYDKEILSAIAEESRLNEAYVEGRMEQGISNSYPITIGRTFSHSPILQQNTTHLFVVRQNIIQALALKGDCVVMGQSADVILRAHRPFNLFVYADMSAKMVRCRTRAPEGENLSDQSLIKKMRQVDAARAKSREMLSGLKWGQKEGYHLCVNTTDTEIKAIAPHIADYAACWLGIHGL